MLLATDRGTLKRIVAWFGSNLRVPTRLSLANRPRRQAQAICWFKDSANEHIGNIREYGLVLEQYGLLVDELRTKRPGYITYQDRYQAAACPFADTPA